MHHIRQSAVVPLRLFSCAKAELQAGRPAQQTGPLMDERASCLSFTVHGRVWLKPNTDVRMLPHCSPGHAHQLRQAGAAAQLSRTQRKAGGKAFVHCMGPQSGLGTRQCRINAGNRCRSVRLRLEHIFMWHEPRRTFSPNRSTHAPHQPPTSQHIQHQRRLVRRGQRSHCEPLPLVAKYSLPGAS